MLCWKVADGLVSGQELVQVFVVLGSGCGECEGVMLGGLGRWCSGELLGRFRESFGV